ncbi:MAG: serine hydroxymethyltransferase [Clostridia bacterium]|nr:serine hydroxymethyltransferase [Clostridia bacterium]
MNKQIIAAADPALFALLSREISRQDDTLDMMASESIQDPITLALTGSAFANKTAVGLPGHQRLLGAEVIDELEILAAERAKKLFGAEHANMLPYSGTTANICVYDGILSKGDRILALDPEHGSHASHGREAHVTARMYNFVHFGVDPATQLIDYDQLRKTAGQVRPKILLVGSSSYPRLFDYELLAHIAHSVGAVLMADIAHTSGLTAAGVIPSPFPHADIVTASCTKTMCSTHTGFILCKQEFAPQVDRGVYPGLIASIHPQMIAAAAWAMKRAATPEFQALMKQLLANTQSLAFALHCRGLSLLTGGTDCHMFVLDLRNTDTNGKKLGEDLGRIGIWVNSKSIPHDVSSVPMGIRAGCTVLTQRGMGEQDMPVIADLICKAVSFGHNCPTEGEIVPLRQTVRTLCEKFKV